METIKKCVICGNDVKIDNWDNGKCKVCGWHQNEESFKNPEKIIYPNITAFNHATKLFHEGKQIVPTFEEFILIVLNNYEPHFKYKNKNYGCTNFNGYEFFEWNEERGYQNYPTIEEFKEKVNINGLLLKDIWDSIKKFQLGC